MRRYSLTTLILMLLSPFGAAQDTPKGWRWYNEPRIQQETLDDKPKAVPQNSTTTVTTTMSATQQMKWFQETYQEALNDATINPEDEDKYRKVMQLNQFISNQTTKTGMTHKKLLLKHPELSYVKDRPVEQAARSAYLDQERAKKIEAVMAMKAKGWGFFFIYDGKDTMSQTLAPSMQQFADTYQLELLGLSNDGTFIPSIKQNRNNDGKVIVPYTPALVLVNPTTSEFKPLVYGFISQNDLLGRFYNVANDYQTPDF